MAMESTQPLKEMSVRNISWGVKGVVRKFDKLTTFMFRFLCLQEHSELHWNSFTYSRDYHCVLGSIHFLQVLSLYIKGYLFICDRPIVCLFDKPSLNFGYYLYTLCIFQVLPLHVWAG
jgi:hypothetical protein